jgi:hypothetical protein
MVGVIFFHKNIRSIYKEIWIEKCIKSILHQDFTSFKIYELNYGDDDYSFIKKSGTKRKFDFYSSSFDNHADAMNFIITKAFEDGCDYVFNTNMDDFYSKDRISKQIKVLEQGYDIVSSDFCYVEEINGEDVITFYKRIKSFGGIEENIERGHNIIAHPCVAYSKKFWDVNRYVAQQIPREDLLLWSRGLNSGFKFFICDDVLLNYRLHGNQITGNNSSSQIRQGSQTGLRDNTQTSRKNWKYEG